MRERLLLVIAAIPAILLPAGCESERTDTKVEVRSDTTAQDDEKGRIADDIAKLATGKDLSAALDAKTFGDAKDRLIRRGSRIETTLIDSLRRSDDWGVRLGVIEVLMATGTRISVDHLITVLDDPQPLVALRANTLLVEMTQHSEIPTAGAPTAANGLPPVPKPAAGDLALDAEERQWAFWQRANGKTLRAAWASWWTANQGTVEIK